MEFNAPKPKVTANGDHEPRARKHGTEPTEEDIRAWINTNMAWGRRVRKLGYTPERYLAKTKRWLIESTSYSYLKNRYSGLLKKRFLIDHKYVYLILKDGIPQSLRFSKPTTIMENAQLTGWDHAIYSEIAETLYFLMEGGKRL